MVIGSWNVNSIRARAEHVKRWLEVSKVDVLLMQELKGTEFPSPFFKQLGYESAAVTQKSYNGVAILSRLPMKLVSTTLSGDDLDSHARFLEVMIEGLRVVNIYLPNGNPVGTEKFAYKLAWMDRLIAQMKVWLVDGVPTVVGGDFNVIPEDIDCHKPSSWIHDALFQPESRARYRAMLGCGYLDAFRSLHQAKRVSSLFGTTSAGHSNTTAGFALTTSCSRPRQERCSEPVRLIKDHEPRRSPPITRQSRLS